LVACAGNCDAGPAVTAAELLRGTNIALGLEAVDDCPAFDTNRDGTVDVDELVAAVSAAVYGCGVIPPTRTRTGTPSRTRTATTTRTQTRTSTATRRLHSRRLAPRRALPPKPRPQPRPQLLLLCAHERRQRRQAPLWEISSDLGIRYHDPHPIQRPLSSRANYNGERIDCHCRYGPR